MAVKKFQFNIFNLKQVQKKHIILNRRSVKSSVTESFQINYAKKLPELSTREKNLMNT